MNVVTKIAMAAMLVIVFRTAALFTESGDWRDRTLGWTVMIVYISIGLFYATRYTCRRRN